MTQSNIELNNKMRQIIPKIENCFGMILFTVLKKGSKSVSPKGGITVGFPTFIYQFGQTHQQHFLL